MTLFRLCLVYDWGQHGNIIQYVSSHPRASRPALVCIGFSSAWRLTLILLHVTCLQLLDAVKGLEYLHSLGMPHGNLKGVGS